MKTSGRDKSNSALGVLIIISLLMAFLWIDSGQAQDAQPLTIAGVSTEEALRLGEKMYREGTLPSGEPMQAVVKGDIPVSGTAFTCLSCHQRSGIGSIEGRVLTPPTNGSILYRPLRILYKGFRLERPAYTDESLAEALRAGVDPSGRVMSDVMPRYPLEDKDMALLISYLKSLSSQFSPGVSDTAIRFATVVSEDVSPEDRNSMLVPLQNWSKKIWHITIGEAADDYKVALFNLKRLLSVWELKGPPETWRSQLEEYNRKEPAFALVGGITTGEWKPIHDFCEANRIPDLFPLTDFPVVSETDWYTLYFSKGYYQEGEGAARYLNSMSEQIHGRAIVQIVRDSREGKSLSAGFQKTWQELGQQPPVTITLKEGQALTKEILQKVSAEEKPAVLILWGGPEVLPPLETFASGKNRPEMVFISSGYIGKDIWTLKEEVRGFTYITYPFRFSKGSEIQRASVEPFMRKGTGQGNSEMILKRTYSLTTVLSLALMDMRGNYYRDNFLDVIGMMEDKALPLYERLSFGPGQRYASKGCYIVQLTKGPEPELIKKSDWVVH
ncbi:MAG: ABC transporter substrate-binding protein [Thermodesulfovibrionales bacterium]